MRSKRIDSMATYIQENKSVTINQLCDKYQVSINTVRRDIVEILKNDGFKKIYGGITYVSDDSLTPFPERHVNNQNLKEQIARKAASLVTDGDIIFIDSGTTTYHMIDYLKDKKDLTILTHNLEVLSRAVPYENLHVVALPGDLNHKSLSFTGLNTAKYLSSYNISKAFLATAGLSLERGLTNSSPTEYEIKIKAISRSQINYVLADHSKFNKVSLLTYNNYENIHAVITDENPDYEFIEFFENKNVEVIVC